MTNKLFLVVLAVQLLLTSVLFPNTLMAGEKDNILKTTTVTAWGATGLPREAETTGITGSCISDSDLTGSYPRICVSVIQNGQMLPQQCRDFANQEIIKLNAMSMIGMFLLTVQELCVPRISSTGSS